MRSARIATIHFKRNCTEPIAKATNAIVETIGFDFELNLVATILDLETPKRSRFWASPLRI